MLDKITTVTMSLEPVQEDVILDIGDAINVSSPAAVTVLDQTTPVTVTLELVLEVVNQDIRHQTVTRVGILIEHDMKLFTSQRTLYTSLTGIVLINLILLLQPKRCKDIP